MKSPGAKQHAAKATRAVRGTGRSKGRLELKTVTTKGEGLVCDGSWRNIRSLIYQGQGG